MLRATFGTRALVTGLAVSAMVAGCDCDGKTKAVNPKIEVSPAAIDFGKVALGGSGEQLVDVRNSGNGPLDIKDIVLTTPAKAQVGDQAVDEVSVIRVLETDCSGNARDAKNTTIEGGGCARFEVRYVPAALHAISAAVTISSSDGENPELVVPITGSGVSSKIEVCVLTAAGEQEDGACTHFGDPDPANAAKIPELDFGAAPIGDTVTRKVRIINEGEGALAVTNAHTESDYPDFSVEGDQYTGKVDPAKSTDVPVVFTPSGDGAETGKLLIASNDTLHPNLEIPIKAVAQGPRLCVQPEIGLDFGSIPVGTSYKLTLNLKNCGFVPYDMSTLEFHEDGVTTPVNFAVTAPNAIPALPKHFAPGDTVDVDLTYTPKAVGKNTGYFSIITDYQRGRVPVIGEGAPQNCGGAVRPTANFKVKKGSTDITANPSVEPLDTVTFDATSSTVPRGGPKYKWRLVSQPQNGTQNIQPRSNPVTANLFAELDGDYVVELVVGDQYGCDSDPKQITVHVASKGKVHVQLTWSQSYGDLDLHLLGPNGRFDDAGVFGGGTDCFYANCKIHESYSIDWGLNNTTQADRNPNNDPTLDIDTLWGNGPENITDDNPFDATYTVLVHYYCSRQPDPSSRTGVSRVSMGPATATVRVFVNGVQKYTATQSLTQRDKWSVATIQVSNHGQTINVNGLSGQISKSTADIDACTADRN